MANEKISNLWKHFSTDPYNFLFVYVFKFLSVFAFCRWMSFMFTIKDIIASKETIKSKLPNFQIIFWRSPCSWLLYQDWNITMKCFSFFFALMLVSIIIKKDISIVQGHTSQPAIQARLMNKSLFCPSSFNFW